MTIPEKVKCPICGNDMAKMETVEGQNIALSSLTAKVEGDRKHLKTRILICQNCNNIQSFIEYED